MTGINQRTYFFLCTALLLAAASCKKQEPAATATLTADTLAQHIYAVSPAKSVSADGAILVSPYNFSSIYDSGTLMVMNGKGQLLMEKSTPYSALNFRRWTINGHIRYTWFTYDPAYYKTPSNSIQSGCEVIADENLNEIKRISLVAHDDITVTKNEGLDVHDFILLDDDHYLAMAYYEKTVTNIPDSITSTGAGLVMAPIIQEVQDGQVIWQWEATDFPEFYGASVEFNGFSNTSVAQDYMHMNAMIIDPRDNNLICSFRNTDQVVKINRKTGAIMWRLGGSHSDFALTDDQVFLRQHFPVLADDNNTLMIFDNGLAAQRPYSRILEFQLDEASKSVTGFKSYNIPEVFTQYMGSVQKTGDHYFIGGGTGNYVLEVNYLTGEKTLEMISGKSTYRAFKYP